jgi:hypothetical protein
MDSGGTLNAHLSDNSAADYIDTTPLDSGVYSRNYTLTYRASAPGQTLRVTWTMTSGPSFGNITLSGAALSTSTGSCDGDSGDAAKYCGEHGVWDGTAGDRAGLRQRSFVGGDGDVHGARQRSECELQRTDDGDGRYG